MLPTNRPHVASQRPDARAPHLTRRTTGGVPRDTHRERASTYVARYPAPALVAAHQRGGRLGMLAAGVLVVLLGGVVAGAVVHGTAPTKARAATAAPTSALAVQGNSLVNPATNQAVVLHGVNRSGTEYACIQGWGIFDGPSDAASVQAIAAWGATLVRVPLNEDCWLGINGVSAAYSGQNYQSAIESYVALLHQYGIHAELSLIWGAPGSNRATYQPGAPDEDHSPAFWSSLATAFKNDHQDILAPWGETIVDANCFLNGGVCEATYGPSNMPYNTAGMQQAATVMRQAGYTGVISIPGITYANDLTAWLSHEPKDTLAPAQIAAEAHVYGNNTCGAQNNGACLTQQMAPVAAAVPLIFGETGETYDGSECTANNMRVILSWADAHHVSWAAWTWDTWGNCSALVSNYNGTPNTTTPANAQYALYIHNHMLAYGNGGPAPSPSPNPSPSPSPSETATGTLGAWSHVVQGQTNTVSVDSSLAASGTYSLKVVKTAGNGAAVGVEKEVGADLPRVDIQFDARFDRPQGHGTLLFALLQSHDEFLGGLALTIDAHSGRADLKYHDGANQWHPASVEPTFGTWHHFDLQLVAATGNTGSFILSMDGKVVAHAQGIPTATATAAALTELQLGAFMADMAPGLTLHFDNVQVATLNSTTSTGSGPSETPSPINVVQVPCTVTLPTGATQQGMCSGTFQPNTRAGARA